MDPDPTRAPSRPGAWRVTFAYDGDRVRIAGRQRVATVPPPDDADAIGEGAAGFWVELRDRDGRRLYAQVIANPLPDEPEVFSSDPGERLHRVHAAAASGAFQVLVPDHPDGHEIVLHGRPTSAEVAQRGSRQLVRGVLREQEPEGLV